VRASDQLLGPHHPIKLAVTKRIPVAAGLGGGSADGAATLRLLNRVLDLKLTRDRLAEIGRPLGADLPMCVLSRPLIARGVGEAMTAVAGMPRLPLVLVCAPVAVRTADVFAALNDPRGSPLPALPAFRTADDVAAWLPATRNDLEDAAARVSPAAAAGAAALSGDPDCLFARMTGSGPAAFGIFASPAAAAAAAARLARAEPSWWVQAATTGS
jgi:4-diphosphocytidyl-2-C-methyl-D-erythritol kinase